jgi:hypothetical protein
VIFVEDAGGAIAGEPGVEASERVGYTLVDASALRQVFFVESLEAFAEARGVFVRDGEDSDAALGAAGMADEVVTAASIGVGNCGVYDLEKGLRHGDDGRLRADG